MTTQRVMAHSNRQIRPAKSLWRLALEMREAKIYSPNLQKSSKYLHIKYCIHRFQRMTQAQDEQSLGSNGQSLIFIWNLEGLAIVALIDTDELTNAQKHYKPTHQNARQLKTMLQMQHGISSE